MAIERCRSAWRGLAGCCVLALLGGCLVGPHYVEPPAPLDAAFELAAVPGAGGGASLAEWWRGFGDPVLEALVAQAIAANHDLRIAAANLRQARELLIEARYELYPIVPAQAGYERQRASELAAPAGLDRDRDLYFGGFDAAWELDLFGRVRRNVESRTAQVEVFAAAQRDVLVSVIGEVARNYFELRGTQQRLTVAHDNIRNQQGTYDVTMLLLDGGRGTELDTSRARSQLESTRASIPPLETTVAQAIYRLGVLVGASPAALEPQLLPAAALPSLPDALGIGNPADLVRRRPDIRVAERSLAAATARIGVNVADLYPRLTFVGSVGLEADAPGDLFESDAGTLAFGPRLTWAAFDLGRVRARIRASEAVADAELANFERTVLRALEEVDGALVAYGAEHRRQARLRAAEKFSRKASELARQRYEDGVSDFLTVLDAERRTLETQDQLAESRTRTATALVAVYKALGGGWEQSLP